VSPTTGPERGLAGAFAGDFPSGEGGGPPGIFIPVPTTRAAFSSRVIAAIIFFTGSLPSLGAIAFWAFPNIKNATIRTEEIRILFIKRILFKLLLNVTYKLSIVSGTCKGI
jgi:hypothetical protein